MSDPHPRPHDVADLAMAPVLINIERNLALLRDSDDLESSLALDLNDDGRQYITAGERAGRVQAFATREVDLHGWTVTPTPDLQGLAVSHGEYTVSVMLGKQVANSSNTGPRPGPEEPAG